MVRLFYNYYNNLNPTIKNHITMPRGGGGGRSSGGGGRSMGGGGRGFFGGGGSRSRSATRTAP